MPLAPGTRLGPYEIVAAIGAGGMGEVYSARDRRLDRFVAVKTLTASIAESADGRQRFEREAKAISRLSHPHICALYDVGHEGDVEYLVMELLEGETLARRLTKGPLPMTQVLRYGREIGEALAAAHRQGIVHRDLKPGNVMLTSSGVKLLDFGLAKTTGAGGPVDAGEASTAALPASLTADGTLLGTAPYMAPEQIQGQQADARSDIFALGAVLYEMASGRRAFAGATAMAIAGSILHEDPPSFSESKAPVSPAFGRLVRTCLAKDPASRWQTAQDVALQLTGIEEDTRTSPATSVAIAPARAAWRPWVLAAAALIAVAGVSWLYLGRAKDTPVAPVELQIVPPGGHTYWYSAEGTTFAVSPDGTRLAFVAEEGGQNQLWIRSLAAIDAKPVPGTEGANSVFWSPDGQSIAFFAAGILKRLDLSSGIAVSLCQVRLSAVHTGTWSSTGQILFSSVEGEAIRSVSSAGGPVSEVYTPDRAKGELRLVFPSFLPGGARFLYLVRKSAGSGQLMLGEPGRPPRVVMASDSNAAFVEPGYLVFSKDGTLVARRFALSTGDVSGAELPIADAVRYFLSTGMASFAASLNGTVVYQPQRDRDHLAWVDRTGKELGAVGVPGDYLDLRLTSSGRVALFSRSLPSTGTYDIWSLDLDRGTERRLTPDDGASEISPILLKDGQELILASTFGGPPQLARMNLDTGEKTPFFPPVPRLSEPCDVTANGLLAYQQRSERGDYDVWTMPVGGGQPPARLLQAPVTEGSLRFSPDGKLYVFGSFESGRYEAYVASMAGGQKHRLSTGGMVRARWNPNGREVVYLSPDGRLIVVPVRTTPVLELGKEEILTVLKGKPWIDFDIAPDGQRFLAVVRDLVAEEQPLTAKIRWNQTVR